MRFLVLACLLACGPNEVVQGNHREWCQPLTSFNWPADRDTVDRGEKGVFMSEESYQKLWDRIAELEDRCHK